MKTVFAILSLTLLSFAATAHEYFFAFAEVGYNDQKQSFEITLIGSAHDVEDVLNASGIAIKELEDHYTDAVMLAKIEGFIRDGFALSTGGKQALLVLKGMEVQPNGLVHFYLASEPITLAGALDVRFDWLMNELPQQQNKVTFSHHSNNYTAVFLPHQRTNSIQFATK